MAQAEKAQELTDEDFDRIKFCEALATMVKIAIRIKKERGEGDC